MDARSSAQVRARLIKEQAVLKAWLEAGLRAWLSAPASEGGMGFDAARTEVAVRRWHPPEREQKEERDA